MRPGITRRTAILWVVAAALYGMVYGARIGVPPVKYYDEIYMVTTAQQFAALSGYEEHDVHPPFGMELMALSLRLFGDHPAAWRAVSLAAGFGVLAFVYAVMLMLTRSPRAAVLATGLLSLDGLAFTQARVGMLNALMLCLMLGALWCLMRHLVDATWPRRTAFAGAGLLLGLALATRWAAAGIVPVMGLLLWLRRDRLSAGWLYSALGFFVLLPVAVYFSTYLLVPFLNGYSWSSIWTLQGQMLQYHLNLVCDHRYASMWWTWPLLLRPIWYFFEMVPPIAAVRSEQVVQGILCIGNPAIFWVMPLAMGYAIWQWVARRAPAAGVVLLGFLSQWLPWAVVGRPKYFHYFYPAMPFVVMALALGLERLWVWGRAGQWAVAGYLVVVAGVFAYWYPLLTAIPVSDPWFRQHLWLRSWL